VFVVVDKIGCLSLGLDESFGIEPFREFNVPMFCFSDKFDRDNKFIFAGCFAKYESIVVN
jgi:hypothetical protein